MQRKESDIDIVAQALGIDRQAMLGEFMLHVCTMFVRMQLHPGVIVAAGLEAFRQMLTSTMPGESFTPWESQCMFAVVEHYAENPQDLRNPKDLTAEMLRRPVTLH